jgi:hypothetical protein
MLLHRTALASLMLFAVGCGDQAPISDQENTNILDQPAVELTLTQRLQNGDPSVCNDLEVVDTLSQIVNPELAPFFNVKAEHLANTAGATMVDVTVKSFDEQTSNMHCEGHISYSQYDQESIGVYLLYEIRKNISNPGSFVVFVHNNNAKDELRAAFIRRSLENFTRSREAEGAAASQNVESSERVDSAELDAAVE